MFEKLLILKLLLTLKSMRLSRFLVFNMAKCMKIQTVYVMDI